MSRLKLFLCFVFLWNGLVLEAQSNFDLRLSLDTIDCVNNTACYNVQLRSVDGAAWGLAGQNYRLYYDGALASWQSGISTLTTDYQSFTLVQDIQHADASAVNGSLAFEDNLSFLNYTMDLNNTSSGGIDLPADSSWVTTSQLCFTLEAALVDDPSTCLEIVWAKDGVTNEYATSFVEVSEFVMVNTTQIANGQFYDGLSAADGAGSCITNYCYASGQYDIRLAFDSIDCINKMGCFDVQLRSADGTSWGLAGQNYRIYYDASLASWRSGISVLPNSYQDFTLIQDLQDIDASATNSNLAFEDNLAFLNYTMDLNNLSTGGINLPADGSWVTTSQLCFFLEDTLLNTPSTCLEAIWARDTLTADYATSFVEISQWIQADSTQMAEGVFYDDLDSTDGNDACFDRICIFDYGDLPDISNDSTSNDYQTLSANGGPAHLVITGLSLGTLIDDELDGQPDATAMGDGVDEDGLMIFSSLNLGQGGTFRLALTTVNTTGNTAYIEAWIDWNGDGDFSDANEMVTDINDVSGFPSFLEIPIPPSAKTSSLLGLRIRLSNTDNMTPYGAISTGEVEDYLISITCPDFCLPAETEVLRKP